MGGRPLAQALFRRRSAAESNGRVNSLSHCKRDFQGANFLIRWKEDELNSVANRDEKHLTQMMRPFGFAQDGLSLSNRLRDLFSLGSSLFPVGA